MALLQLRDRGRVLARTLFLLPGNLRIALLRLALVLLHVLDLLLQRVDVDLQLLLDRDVLPDVGLVLLQLSFVFFVLQVRVQGAVVVVDVVGGGLAEDVAG